MRRFFEFAVGRTAVFAAVVVALASLFASERSYAVPLPFTAEGGAVTMYTVTGTNGVMSFTLNLNDSSAGNIGGSFDINVFGPPAPPPAGPLLGSISLAGVTDGSTIDFHSIVPGVTGDLPNLSLFNLPISLLDLPLTIVIIGNLTSFGVPLLPSLTVDFTGDLAISQTPLPAAFPLFAAGLGVLGWAARRRRSMIQAAA